MVVDATLRSWSEVGALDDWSGGLLIGNGASRAVWPKFEYTSLFDKACSREVAHPLKAPDQAVFATVGTHNFEATMAGLRLSSQICQALGIDSQLLDQRYSAIRDALIEAVHAVHVTWSSVTAATKTQIRKTLLEFDYVYSTNYDLLLYWAMMADDLAGFRDYFWGIGDNAFDITNTEVWSKATKVLFLHGGLHIYRLPDGRTVKKTASGGNLLATFGQPYHGVDIPLFIAEGTSEDKLRSIRRSEYLSFGYARFADHHGPMVVFGQALGAPDAHLVGAMQRWNPDDVPRVAISMMPATNQTIVARKAALHEALPKLKLEFFDATTHPLGDAALRAKATFTEG